MQKNTHNGFVLRYDGTIFAVSRSNAVTYECFCLKGGLSNWRMQKIEHHNGSHSYFTYHDCSTR